MPDAQQHIAAIRAALERRPTGGVWFVSHECRRDDEAVCDLVNNTWVLKQPHIQLGSWEADAAHIAACHPEAMRAILAHIEALEADAERYRWLRGLDWWAEPEIGLEIDGSAWRVTFSSPAPFENASDGSWLDAAIDAARKAST